MRALELRRHTDNDGDTLTDVGVRAAAEIGSRLSPSYALFASSGAHRAKQTAEILRHAVGQDDVPITCAPGLRSAVEERWRDAGRIAGKGADLEQLRRVDADLVEKEAWLLGSALDELLGQLPEGTRGLVVGHSPTLEAALLGLTGQLVAPLSKGAGVLLVEDRGRFRLQPLDGPEH